jgi:phage tail sheath gpL-like
MIPFTQIPSTIGVPGSYAEFDGTGARRGQAGKPQVLGVYGQMSAAKTVGNPNGSTAAANIPVQVQSASEASKLFGADSILSGMLAAVFKTNSINQVWVIPQLDDAAGVARVVTANYAAPYPAAATAPGIERVYIGGSKYAVSVVIGDTATTIAAKLAATITADPAALFTATAATGTLTLTAKNKGEVANDIQIVAQYYSNDTAAGAGYVTFTQSTAGAGNPSVAAGIASASTMYMTHVVLPYNDAANYALMLAEAQDRWAPLPASTSLGNGQQDFIVFRAFRGSESQINTFMQGFNSEYFSTMGVEPGQTINTVQYAGSLSGAFEHAAADAAMSASLASVVANNPHQNVVLNCLKGAPMVTRFPWNVRNRMILSYGCATYKYNDAQQVVYEAAITERLTTDSGAVTDAERRVETQLAKSYIRWSVNQMLDTQFPAMRLADDGTPGLPNNVATPMLIKGAILALCKNVWVPNGVVENFDQFKATLNVERSTNDCNTISYQMFPDIVNILTVKAGKISYIVC